MGGGRAIRPHCHQAGGAALENQGDFIPAGTPIKLSALGLSAQSKLISLYAESIGHTSGPARDRIVVGFDPDGPEGPLFIICRDAARVRPIRFEFAIPGSYDEAPGLPAPAVPDSGHRVVRGRAAGAAARRARASATSARSARLRRCAP